MSSFIVEKKFDLSKITFDMSKQLNEFADAIVLDHKNRLQFGQGVDMKPMAKLKGSTIASKRFKRLKKPRIPLYGTGLMSKVYVKKRASKTKQRAIVIPPKKRKEIAKYHQYGTSGPYPIRPIPPNNKLGPIFTNRGEMTFRKKVMHPGLKKREWFGITVKQEKVGLRLISNEIERVLKNA